MVSTQCTKMMYMENEDEKKFNDFLAVIGTIVVLLGANFLCIVAAIVASNVITKSLGI